MIAAKRKLINSCIVYTLLYVVLVTRKRFNVRYTNHLPETFADSIGKILSDFIVLSLRTNHNRQGYISKYRAD